MRSIILLMISLLLTSCGPSLRRDWRARIQDNSEIALMATQPEASLEELLARIDGSVEVQTIRANLRRHERNLLRAQIALNDQALALRALGMIYLNNRLYLAALAEFERALEITPANALLHYYAGISSGWSSNLVANIMRQESLEVQAFFHLNRSAELDPTHPDTALALATLYTTASEPNLERATFHLRRYRSMRPHTLEAILIEASIAARGGNTQLARTLYQQLIEQTQRPSIREQAARAMSMLP